MNVGAAVFRCGYVAVVGRPNVGKSTLINAIVGQKIAIASPRPQTTRRLQLGIHTTEHQQFVLLDTPGVQRPRHALGKSMRAAATHALQEANVVLWVVDVSRVPGEVDKGIGRMLREICDEKAVVLAMNKSDRLRHTNVVAHTDAFRALAPKSGWMLVSATRGYNVLLLLDEIARELPEGAAYYPDNRVTETNMRELAGDLVMEAAMCYLQKEIPYGVGVVVGGFEEHNGEQTTISVTIVVESERHKGIIIGKRGEMLKQIGTRARREMAVMIGGKVHLRTHVKVLRNWRNDVRQLTRMGY